MNYPRVLMIVGLLIILVPFLGVPLLWKHILTVALGMLVIALTILLRSSLRVVGKQIKNAEKVRTAIPRVRKPVASLSKRNLSSAFQSENVAPTITSESLIEHDEA